MTSTPDTTAAFEADAAREEEAAELRARLAALEASAGHDTPEATTTATVEDGDAADDDAYPNVATVGGHYFRFRTPRSGALAAMGLGATAGPQVQLPTMQMFLATHIHEEDYQEFLRLLMDPGVDFEEDQMGELMEAIVDAGAESAEVKAPKTGPVR